LITSMKGYVSSSEGQIHYRRAGVGAPLVLLHQVPSSSWMWEPLLDPLARRGYAAVAFDLPGYGMSDPPATSPDLTYYARSIADSAAAVGLQRFGVVGHHTGGSVALRLAVDRPELVTGLVVYGLALLDPEFSERLASEQPPEYDGEGAAITKFWKARWGEHTGEMAEFIASRATAEMLTSMKHRPDGHVAVGRADHVAMVRALRRPVLAVAGRREMLYHESQRGPALSPMVQFQEMADAGIDVVDEMPDRFAEVIDEFFKGLAAAPDAARGAGR
jgi:pimeloyl-ACP methyl ester carboxylesterase